MVICSQTFEVRYDQTHCLYITSCTRDTLRPLPGSLAAMHLREAQHASFFTAAERFHALATAWDASSRADGGQ